MYLQIKTIELKPDTYGKHIKITKVGLYDETGKWQQWVKLDEEVLTRLLAAKIPVKL